MKRKPGRRGRTGCDGYVSTAGAGSLTDANGPEEATSCEELSVRLCDAESGPGCDGSWVEDHKMRSPILW